MKRRAELEAETRRRITETAVELHGTLGPARTSISAIAERAGVRRSTVYRHFPDEAALIGACSSHWAAANPVPDMTAWQAIDDPDHRLRTALAELYAYYRRTEQMMDNLHRDELTMPLIAKHFEAVPRVHRRRAGPDDAAAAPCAAADATTRAPPSATHWRTPHGGRWRVSRAWTTRRPPS